MIIRRLQDSMAMRAEKALARRVMERVRDIPAARSIPDFERRMEENIARCMEVRRWLGLHRGDSLDVLDIGTGYGFLPYLCKEAGHRVQLSNYWSEGAYGANPDHGSHNEASDIFRQAHDRLGLRAMHLAVETRQPLPVFEQRVDVVVAMGTMFNMDWTIDDYAYWLRDMATSVFKPAASVRLAIVSNNYDGVVHPNVGWKNFMEGREALSRLPGVERIEATGLRALIHLKTIGGVA